MEYSKEQLDAVAKTLKQVVTDSEVKLRWGALKRAEMHAANRRGDKTETYRTEWIRKSRARVIELLLTLSNEFNRTWKHDRASSQDLMDVLVSAYRLMETHLKSKT